LGGAPSGALKSSTSKPSKKEGVTMLWTLAVIFLVLWAMGFVAFHVTTGFIHLLLIAAAIVVVVQLVSRRSTV
jgi:hypothetical protein